VDPLKEGGREAIFELLEALLGEQGAAGGVEGDEGAVEEGVGEGAWVEEDDPGAGADWEAVELARGGLAGAEAVTGALQGAAEADGFDGL
jgi:hypothetical protein